MAIRCSSGAARPGAARSWSRAAALVALLALAACDPFVEGNGVLGEDERKARGFDAVAVQDGIRAVVTAGADWRVVVTGDENVLRNVGTPVVFDPVRNVTVLDVSVDFGYRSQHPLQVLVSVPALRLLRARDGSPVVATGVASPALVVEASGGSDVSVTGPSGAGERTLEVVLGGGAHLDAAGYPVQSAEVQLDGGAWAEVWVSGAVTGALRGGSKLENAGAGSCAGVEKEATSTLVCAP